MITRKQQGLEHGCHSIDSRTACAGRRGGLPFGLGLRCEIYHSVSRSISDPLVPPRHGSGMAFPWLRGLVQGALSAYGVGDLAIDPAFQVVFRAAARACFASCALQPQWLQFRRN